MRLLFERVDKHARRCVLGVGLDCAARPRRYLVGRHLGWRNDDHAWREGEGMTPEDKWHNGVPQEIMEQYRDWVCGMFGEKKADREAAEKRLIRLRREVGLAFPCYAPVPRK